MIMERQLKFHLISQPTNNKTINFPQPYIAFQSEDTDFEFNDIEKTIKSIHNIIANNNKTLHFLDYIFCSDKYLYNINNQHLNHNTYTDIITFNYNEENKIGGDIYISIDRIKENAIKFDAPFEKELMRVIFHGLLHLIGYNDKTEEERQIMRKKEEESLTLHFK